MGQPMQADGKDSKGTGDATGVEGAGGGESGGGAYPDNAQVKTKPGSYGGGQSETTYHGGADDEAGGDNHNAGAGGS